MLHTSSAATAISLEGNLSSKIGDREPEVYSLLFYYLACLEGWKLSSFISKQFKMLKLRVEEIIGIRYEIVIGLQKETYRQRCSSTHIVKLVKY